MAQENENQPSHEDARRSAIMDKAALAIAALLLGGILSICNVPPFPVIETGLKATLALWKDVSRGRADILRKSPYDGTGVITYDPARAQPGYTLVQGILPGGQQIRMIDMDGSEVHRWTIDFFDIWPEPKHVFPVENLPKSVFNYHVQGFWPLPDGTVVANVGDLGTVLLDQCSRPIWTVDRMMHHSVTPTRDGKYWIPSHISVFDTEASLFPKGYDAQRVAEELIGKLKNYNNSIALVNSAGEIEKEFSVLRAVFDAGLEHSLYASLNEIPFDPTHINDIEVVNAPLAAALDGVEAGDLLVSIREMNMIAILDQNDGRLKWYKTGPWVRQHDPDIMPDGTIEIFNNRSKRLGDHVQNSQIVSYDPRTDKTTVLHPKGRDDSFFTNIMGTHQRLENNNVLISETVAGRVFETTPLGEVVWDYRLPYDDEVASLFEQSMRVPLEYFGENNWSCDTQ